MESFDKSKYRIGSLCKRGHDFTGDGRSLRQRRGNCCRECVRERSKRHYEANREHHNQLTRRWYAEHKKEHLELSNGWRKRNPEKSKAIQKRHYYKHREKELARRKRYLQTPSGVASDKKSCHNRRCRIKRSVGIKPSIEDYLAISQKTNNRCLYCTKSIEDGMHIDHFIALANNGTHSMGNLVPSCQRCNHSKGSKDPKTWYFSQEFATKKGWKAILKTVGVKDATYNIPLLV